MSKKNNFKWRPGDDHALRYGYEEWIICVEPVWLQCNTSGHKKWAFAVGVDDYVINCGYARARGEAQRKAISSLRKLAQVMVDIAKKNRG